MQSLKQTFCFHIKKISLVNNGQHMLHKLSLDANKMAISYWQVYEYVYTNIFSFGEQILSDYDTNHLGLSDSTELQIFVV